MSPSFFVVSFASINDFTTDKTLYNTDDSIIISGNVDNNPDLFSIILQIITPGGSGLAHVDSIVPNNDGSFTKTINAGGPTWPENGYYIDTKHIDTKHIDTKHIDTKHIDTKHIDTKHIDTKC
jgi:hypothetical protein